MGNYMTKINPFPNISLILEGKRKRSLSTEDLMLEESLNIPKRKKLLTTAQHIYQALYKEEQNSDISIVVLGRTWKLHKLYLQQSPYFKCMFNGNWIEADKKNITIEIADPRVDIASLDVVFGSMYQDEIDLQPSKLVNIFATALVFQLKDLQDRCVESMLETINAETVFNYYEASCSYGIIQLKTATLNWLKINLLSYLYKYPKRILKINTSLMLALITMEDLFVMQTDFSVYVLLRFWLFLKIHPTRVEDTTIESPDVRSFFTASRVSRIPFLYTSTAEPYVEPFGSLNIANLLTHPNDVKVIISDNIIPSAWLTTALLLNWKKILLIDQSIDIAPIEVEKSQEIVRLGRVLNKLENIRWRWTGFYFGIDLVMIQNHNSLFIRRYHRSENERVLSLQVRRHFLIRVTLYSLNEERRVVHQQTTDFKPIVLEQNEEIKLIDLDIKLKFPVLVSVNLVFTSDSKVMNYFEFKEREISNLATRGENDVNLRSLII